MENHRPVTIARDSSARRKPRGRRSLLVFGLVASVLVVGFLVARGKRSGPSQADAGEASARAAEASTPRVEVTHARVGGIERMTVQPGSVHPFETVDLQAMVSGFLKSQSVDIGSRVKKGDVLAEIDAPREEVAVEGASAGLEQSKAKALQAEAQLAASVAERETFAAAVAQTESDIDRVVANRKMTESQYERIKGLHERKAIEGRLVDEHRRDLDGAIANERTANLAVQTAKARLAGAMAKIELSRADLVEARAAVSVAQAQLDKARVDLKYAKIVAPFDGVVTRRNYHPGAFIRSASDGGELSLLTVTRTDLMRVIIKVPDRDVVLTNPGDPAVVTVDGLARREFKGVVSRIAESEDHETRTMRVEVDLPNTDGLLREGMYGKASIGLEPASRRLTLPVSCILERSGKGQGVVQIVRGGKIGRLKVELGTDNGSLVEVDSGVTPEDEVIVRSSTALEDGTAVIATASR